MIVMLLIALVFAVEGAMADGPDPTDRLGVEIARLYEAAAGDVAAAAAREIGRLSEDPTRRSSAFGLGRQQRLARQIEQRLARLGVERDAIIQSRGSEVVQAAVRATDAELDDMGIGPSTRLGSGAIGGAGAVGFDLVDERPVSVVARDTLARLDLSTLDRSIEQTARSANTLFRTLSVSPANVSGSAEVKVNTAIARALVSGDRTIADRAVRDLFRDPNDPTGESVRKLGGRVITVGKREMTVRDYADTVARTRMREATVAASRERMTEKGIRLGQITGSNSSNFCTAFVGLVVSLTGSSEVVDGVTYRPVEQLPGGGPPFHPRCSKSVAAFDPALSSASRVAASARAEQVYQRRAATGRLLSDFN